MSLVRHGLIGERIRHSMVLQRKYPGKRKATEYGLHDPGRPLYAEREWRVARRLEGLFYSLEEAERFDGGGERWQSLTGEGVLREWQTLIWRAGQWHLDHGGRTSPQSYAW